MTPYTHQSKNIRKTWMWIIMFFVVGFALPFVGHAERIKDFSSDIAIQDNADVTVTEKIIYDFEGAQRHGIFRDIPLRNNDGSLLHIDIISINDERGNFYTQSVTESNSVLHIKIGDPSISVSGIKTYQISYRVKNALVSFDAYDELYWNVTGNGWKIPIDRASAEIYIARGHGSFIQSTCYQGSTGSSQKCATNDSQGNFSAQGLQNGQGLTAAVGFSKGLINGITRRGGQTNEHNSPSSDNPINKIIAIAFAIIVLVGTYFYSRKMSDPKSKNPVVAWYEPPAHLSPILLGTLVDKTTDMRDVTGQILYLATRGYISITRVEKKELLIFNATDYIFTVTKDLASLEFAGERRIIEMLFSNPNAPVGTTRAISELKGLKTQTQLLLKAIQEVSKSFLTEHGYYEVEQNKIVPKFVGVVLVSVPLVLERLKIVHIDLFVGVSMIIVALCGIIIIRIKQKRTQLGVDTRQEILGFKEFLSVTDKERFDFHNAPEKNPTQFMEYLPYAVAFGIEKKWAQQFKDMMIPEPSWYHGGVRTFIAADFVSHMSGMNTAFAAAATPARSGSGGGGFSGGGGGGGGGGSW